MWRLRAEIYTESIVIQSKIENDSFIIRVTEFTDENSNKGSYAPANYRLLDIFLVKEEKDILEAFAVLYNEMNCFIDRLSYVSYGNAYVYKLISITPNLVEFGDFFELAVPRANLMRKTKNIRLSDLNFNKSVSIENRRWERLLRIGINSKSEEEKYISYYSLLEEIARLECKENIVTTCKKCEHENDTGRKKTGDFILKILENHGLDKKTRKEASKIRHKIAHGGKEKNKEYFANVSRIGSHLEEICLIELEKRIGIDIINRLKTHITDIPILKHTCVCICVTDKDFDFVKSQLIFETRFVKLKHSDESKFQGQSLEAGISFKERPHLSNLAYPLVLYPKDNFMKTKIYTDLGGLYYSHNEADKAIECYSFALKFAEESDNKETIAGSYYNLGLSHLLKNEKKEAKRFWEMSLNLYKELKSPNVKTIKDKLDEI